MIRQFDVHRNPTTGLRRRTPFVVVLQSHYVDSIDTVVVAPLHAGATTERLGKLSIAITIDQVETVLVLSELAYLPHSRLGRRVSSLLAHEDDIRRALDRLFTGF